MTEKQMKLIKLRLAQLTGVIPQSREFIVLSFFVDWLAKKIDFDVYWEEFQEEISDGKESEG